MKIPVIRGVIERRILVNYRADAGVVAAQLPAPFRPKLHRGYAMVGICLIRLRDVRPRWVPAWAGIRSENAAHRTAVLWDENGRVAEGVYVARRDTSSRFNACAGGRLFPGIHSHADFRVAEAGEHFEVALASDDGITKVAVAGDVAEALPRTSIFESLAQASSFFEGGSLGYSATRDATRFHGLELRCKTWHVDALTVSNVRSSVFDDRARFPDGTIAFDCALVMRGVDHEWHGHADLCCPTVAEPVGA
jgi:uncharacterized protein YqjF (DUF2071 family)